jgi:polyhydroxyalkanoate synthase
VIRALARRPDVVARRAGALAGELARVAVGGSEREAAKGDRRFADRGWHENWLLHRLMQAYLALGDTVDELITDAELDWRPSARRASRPATCSTRLRPPTTRGRTRR